MLETLQRMAAVARSAKLAAMPNAGSPAYVDGRYVYLCTPEYMATCARRFLAAGVSVVGGCCGTTPAHIRDLVRSVRMFQPGRAVEVQVVTPERRKEAPAPVPREAEGAARPRARQASSWSRSSSTRRSGADAGPDHRARAVLQGERGRRDQRRRRPARLGAHERAGALRALQERVGIDTILHYTCRDRNLLGIQSDLLGAHALGLRNMLAITGDPPKLGDYPDATAVYDVDSIGLIRIMDNLNHGADLAGNLIGPSLAIHVGCGADPSKPDMEKEVRRLEEKVEGGAEYIMTQPVYDPRSLERFLSLMKHLDVPVLVGILPLYSHKNAEFLHNEVPGHEHPRRHPRAHARGGLRRAGAARGRERSPRRRRSRPASWRRASTSCRPSTRWIWRFG